MHDYDHNADFSYKIAVLSEMLNAETDEKIGGYGAHLTHWAGTAAPINLGAGALRALIAYYETLNK